MRMVDKIGLKVAKWTYGNKVINHKSSGFMKTLEEIDTLIDKIAHSVVKEKK